MNIKLYDFLFYGLLGSITCFGVSKALASSESGFVAGGLVFKSNPKISRLSEDLLISVPENKIRVEYTFKNKSDQDQELLIGFPIPTHFYDLDYDKDLPAYKQLDPLSETVRDRGYTNFKTWVDGEIVTWWPLFHGNIEQQELCQEHWLKRNTLYDEAGYCFKDFPGRTIFDNSDCVSDRVILTEPNLKKLEEINLREKNLSCEKTNKSEYFDWQPSGRSADVWDLKNDFATVLSRQKLSANKTIKVVHEYSIDWGGGIFWPLDVDVLFGNDEDYKIYCARNIEQFYVNNPSVSEYLDNVHPNLVGLDYNFTTYILKTGKNWNQPTGKFRLEIQNSPDTLLDVCHPELKKVSENSFVYEQDDFSRDEDISIWIYKAFDIVGDKLDRSTTLDVLNAADLIFDDLSLFTGLHPSCVSVTVPDEKEVSAAIEMKERYLDFGLREKHNDECGGDPNTAPIAAWARARFDNNGEVKYLYKMDFSTGDYKIVKVFK